MLLSWNIYIAEHFFHIQFTFSFKWHFLAASEGTVILLEYEDFSDIPMFQDWEQSTLKLHVYVKITCITKTVAESTILISTNWMWRYINVSGLGPVKVYITCADQGIFIRGGGSRPDSKKTALTAFFFVCLFGIVLNLLTEGFQWFYFREGLSLSGGSSFFQERGGGGGGGGGPNVNFYRNPYITCDFYPPSGSAHA